jgi:tetratricopeptide (TPR) repeat protein
MMAAAGPRLLAACVLAMLAAPVAAQAPRPSDTDQLLTALKAAPDEQAAAAMERAIRARWAQAATPAIRLLLARARRSMEASPGEAVDDFDAALDLDPSLVEAWRGRAMARFRGGDADGAVRDLQEAVRREPRDFAAFQDLSRMAEGRHDWKGALAAWQRVLEISPRTPGGSARLRDLRRRALGEEM